MHNHLLGVMGYPPGGFDCTILWRACVSGDCVTVSALGGQPLQVGESEEMRAFGFSPDGATFVIATSPGLAIYRREDKGQ
jgi:hypothetical protein